ncbi:permease [Desulfonatronovibrio magnus]|uniref:permease n=1 Tax=Desulfonatronovibrio magnus TaxID=698827 RepID=UPI0005EB965D|nr:permease [Desulfonatronovibrio magnus]
MLETMHNASMIFLSIVFESAPFILMGAFFSSLVLVFIPKEFFQKYLPANPLLSIPPALILSAVFPVCECAIIPVIRGLVRKGMPLCAGAVFLVAAPILNPIVLASSFYAFRFDLQVVALRFGVAALVAVLVGLAVYIFLESRPGFKLDRQLPMSFEKQASPGFFSFASWKRIFDHTVDEFFTVGKYFILGAGIASLFQTMLSQQMVFNLAESVFISPLIMMFMAYVLSLCSTADAFVAASFAHTFPTMSIVAFLVFGPMLDIKNTAMLLGYFPVRFVVVFVISVSIAVYLTVVTLHHILG